MHPCAKAGLLANLLWGDKEERLARQSLTQAISDIRKGFAGAPDNPMRSNQREVSLDVRQLHVDALDLSDLAASNDPKDLEKAIALRVGEFLEGFNVQQDPFEDWLIAERAQANELVAGILRRLLDRYEEQSKLDEAVRVAQRHLTIQPLEETVHRRLMGLFKLQGRTAAAARQYETCAGLLRDELDVAPQPETAALYRTLFPRVQAGARQRTAGPSLSTTLPSIEVELPEVPSGCIAPDYLRYAVTQELTTALGRFRAITAWARKGSVKCHNGRAGLGLDRVDYLVGGTLQARADHFTISLHLMDGESGDLVSNADYDGRYDELSALCEDAASRFAVAVGDREIARGKESMRGPRPAPTAAPREYLKVLHGINQFDHHQIRRNSHLLSRVVRADPGFRVAPRVRAWLVGT
jgi:DNA-binding SARP family transcriptional activator